MRQAAVAALAALVLGVPTLQAQRGELAVLGGIVASPDEEFDRVTSATIGGPSYTRERGRRESGPAFGAAATFAIRGHVFAELGLLHHGVERHISRTGTGDPTGPFLLTTTRSGRLTTAWIGPSYRFVDRDRLAVSALVAPMIVAMHGQAYDDNWVAYNAPTRRMTIGMLFGLRARYWMGERLGLQLSVEDATWTVPLQPHPSDGTPLYPDTYRRTPLQHDLRVHLGASLKLF